MDPVTAVAAAIGNLASAIGNPIAVRQQRKLAEEQFQYGYATQIAVERARARERDTWLILGAVALVAVMIIAANRAK